MISGADICDVAAPEWQIGQIRISDAMVLLGEFTGLCKRTWKLKSKLKITGMLFCFPPDVTEHTHVDELFRNVPFCTLENPFLMKRVWVALEDFLFLFLFFKCD